MTSTYFWPGVAAIWGALFSGAASAATYWRADRGRPELLPLARSLYAAYATCIVAASAVLMTLILQHRFDVSYVNAYSSRDLPLHFLFSSFWGGQEGSFLLWCFMGALIGLVVWRSAKELEAPVMVVYLATFLGIVAILCKQSPFKLLPPPAPADGVGLNPLLQDPWMVIHPPVMFIGFASLSVPFSFAIAALWKKRWDGWIARTLPWALLTFTSTPLESMPSDSLPVDIISPTEFSQLTAGSKTAKRQEAPKPLVEKQGEKKQVEDHTAKISEKKEIQATRNEQTPPKPAWRELNETFDTAAAASAGLSLQLAPHSQRCAYAPRLRDHPEANGQAFRRHSARTIRDCRPARQIECEDDKPFIRRCHQSADDVPDRPTVVVGRTSGVRLCG